ncbi:TPA: hypothetical protein JBG70_15840 [Legionella pneumophila]|uniref:hypothetical protein n=1 Tax=Legionella pneumophila TaxID=446 RepID=UPI000488E978|nr:hypothetical protein [Legionella pneumophila]MCW8434008.1 hypothetical protein [Legionella pneumophila]MDW8959207.1 hypothetical protein [Legionella pneumophila]MDW9009262.1 hypothetical protein [Legionella pneumophila]MDW9183466.1 hypothetical protein [Legionella pneumophila]WAI65865.1 hypothetical protein OXA89_07270 [Legionella pneumophila]
MKKFHVSLLTAMVVSWMNIAYADEQSCNKSYDYCMSSCENQYNQCTKNNDESYCKEQYQPCIQGCSNTRDNCLSQ